MIRNTKAIAQMGVALIICVVAVFLTVCGLKNNNAKEAEVRGWLDSLEDEIQPYQEEIQTLEEEIETATAEHETANDYGRVILAYYVYTPEDIALAKDGAALVFDCTWDDTMLNALAESGRELIMLYSSAEKDKITYDRTVTGVTSVILPENQQDRDAVDLLDATGFEVIFVSPRSVNTGYYEDGIVRMPYVYLSSNIYDVGGYLEELIERQDVSLILFDINVDSIGINNYLDVIHSYEKEGTIEQSTVEEQTDFVINQEEYEANQQAEFDALIAEKQARIDELNEMIAEAFE